MIPSTANNPTNISSFTDEAVKMSVDLNNLGHIMSVLTDLYSNPALAVVREYTTNALDSHAMSGTVRPVEIELPTAMKSTLTIRDFGLGMSAADIENVYGTYGTSTKRKTNDATGCLGLGSKSALTYTTSFTVTAVSNGQKTIAMIYRADDGAGSMRIIDSGVTDEPNGVEISIPVSDIIAMREAAAQFTYYLSDGLVLVDGERSNNVLLEEGFWFDDKTWIAKGGRATDVVVMGGVAYPVNLWSSRNRQCHGRIVYFADMGEVDFVPSREALNLTPRTKLLTVQLHDLAYGSRVLDFVQKQLDAADRSDVANIYNELSWVVRGRGLSWHGTPLNLPSVKARTITLSPTSVDPARDRYVGLFAKRAWLHTNGAVLTSKCKRQLAVLAQERGLVLHTFFEHVRPDNPLLDNDPIVTLEEIDAIEVLPLPKVKAVVKPKPEYDWRLYGPNTPYGRKYSSLPDKGTYDVLVEASPASGLRYDLGAVAAQTGKTVLVVQVGANRLAKFRRENPNSIEMAAFISAFVNDLPEFTEFERLVLELNRYHRWLSPFSDRIADPKLSRALAYSLQGSKLNDKVVLAAKFDRRYAKSLYMDNYPLVSRYHAEASVDYINMIYKEKQCSTT